MPDLPPISNRPAYAPDAPNFTAAFLPSASNGNGNNGNGNVETTSKTAMPASQNAPSPLRSAEAFDSYCAQVQTRLAEHAAQRTHFLQNAFERLTRLLHTARAVEDNALYNELWQHRVAVRELLEAFNQVSLLNTPVNIPVEAASAVPLSGRITDNRVPDNPMQNGSSPALAASSPTLPLPSKPVPLPSIGTIHGGTIHEHSARESPSGPARPGARNEDERTSNGMVREAGNGAYAPAEPMPRPHRHPVRPLIDIEADAVRLRAELLRWQETHPLRRANNELDIPNSLRLRAFACRQRRLEEEAGDTEVAEVTELSKDVVELLDNAGDEEYTVTLDYDLEPAPTAYQWGELAERYDETAHAQDAFEWWTENRATLSVSDIQGLAEAVAAIQQRFNRLLFRIGARDPFQQQLFDDLRVWAREAQCYLFSLRPKVPIAELIEKAQTIDEAWEHARQPVLAHMQRQQSVDSVVSLVSAPGFGDNAEQDEQRLLQALLHCKEMRIPASDRRLRDALLPWTAFLESDERFKEIVREIHLEWERRQEAGKADLLEDEPHEDLDALDTELAAVREVTRGKRCLLLGGTCREENRRKLEEALQLDTLVWPSTKPSDPLSKFDTEIRHSDIVALLTRFSRKEWKNAQDICARDGKKFVHLTSGYGVAQVVRHFYNQIAPEGAAHG